MKKYITMKYYDWINRKDHIEMLCIMHGFRNHLRLNPKP